MSKSISNMSQEICYNSFTCIKKCIMSLRRCYIILFSFQYYFRT